MIARDRTKSAEYQVVPAIVTKVHDEESGLIDATGFPPGGSGANLYDLKELPEVEPGDDEIFGWYWPEKV